MPGVEELVRALSEEERRALFAKIRKALSADGGKRERVIHTELRNERRKELIAADMRSLGPWERLRLWVKRLFSTAGDEAVFIGFRLSQVRDRVHSARPDLVDFEQRSTLPGLVRAVGALYLAARPLIPAYRRIWRDTESLRAVVDGLLAVRIPGAKRSLNEFCTTQELQEEYRRTESRNRLKQIVLDKVDDYMESIPASVMEDVERGVMPLYTFRDVVQYDYGEFFARFDVEPPTVSDELKQDYPAISAVELLPQIEGLYLALHGAARSKERPQVYLEAFGDGTSGDPVRLRDALQALAKYLASDNLETQLGDIIRFFRNDPYYRFVSYTPRLQLQDFYYANLKIELLAELDQRFADLRVGVLGQLMQEVFPSGTIDFEHFDPEVELNIKRAGLGPFARHRSLQVISTFLRRNYHDGLMELMSILPRIVSARMRQTTNIVPVIAAAVDDVTERLRQFDAGFSSDVDEGRVLSRVQFLTSESDNAQVGAVKALVAQKDREAGDIVQKFHDAVDLIVDMLRTVRRGAGPDMNERFAAMRTTAADDRPLTERIDDYVEQISKCKKLVNQIAVIER